ncbi:hypothetical protein QQF64_002695 [Cirrhinus molitorella]|uniref:Uncharacterized protein n=1 Tax=Cirrhinus molitorella TaxID=172907 RepID=A0ABR3MQY7_9TELE
MTADSSSCCSIIILLPPWLPLPWQPVRDVQPYRGRARKNGSTHSYAGAFLRRGVPIMAASSPSSLFSGFPCLLSAAVTSITLRMTALLHLFLRFQMDAGCCSLQLPLCLACRMRKRERQRQEGGSHLFNV